MSVRIVSILAWGMLVAFSAKAGIPVVLYRQPFDKTDNLTSSGPFTVYDDFSLSGGGTVITRWLKRL
ncbi:MAG TPA: hypothetical protein VMR33_05725 [Candidatus Baltobacteraceae bacterium]|nr:hypothetical protein [Candidatus Baltobacteraceae bacterium]